MNLGCIRFRAVTPLKSAASMHRTLRMRKSDLGELERLIVDESERIQTQSQVLRNSLDGVDFGFQLICGQRK